VARLLSSKKNQNLAESILDKLKTIFEKQFLSWATSEGFSVFQKFPLHILKIFGIHGRIAHWQKRRSKNGLLASSITA
jgi:hypothetical protein